jgi:hypothetical protein
MSMLRREGKRAMPRSVVRRLEKSVNTAKACQIAS